MWYNDTMKKSFTLGRAAFAKISEIEGIRLTRAMSDLFTSFDKKNLSPAERRREIAKRYGKMSV